MGGKAGLSVNFIFMKPRKSDYLKYDKKSKEWTEIYPGISGVAYMNATKKHIANQGKISRVKFIETNAFVNYGNQRHFGKVYTAIIDGKEVGEDTCKKRLLSHLKFIYR